MKFVVAIGFSAWLVAISVVGAQAKAKPSGVFACSIGGKLVSVTKSGDRFVYHFGVAGKDELAIVGDPSVGNILQMSQRFTGPENQLSITVASSV
jgi:hypothetical protein